MDNSAPSSSAPAANSPTSWIDRLCGRFEQSWRDAERPRVEDYLAEVPPAHRKEILTELLAIELEIRRGQGEDVDLNEYLRRFPEDETTVERVCRGASRLFADTVTLPQSGTTPNVACTATRYADLAAFRRGGLGELYRAHDQDLHREVVIKSIHEKCGAEPELLAQFRIEAEITGRLDHPGVVPVYGIGEHWNGRPFYVMRMVHGRELRQAIQEYHEAGGPVNRSRDNRRLLFALLEHLASACNTVAYAHDVGIVHCDLKPANIMIGKYGETLVVDWGLATSFERTSTFVAANEPTMRPRSADSSQSGKRGGTFGYISPEQLSPDEQVTPASDVYSLGATLYEILCGRAPFNGHNPGVIDEIRHGKFRRPRELNHRVPRRLEAISLKAMSLMPTDRYRTAKLLAADLKNWMHDDEVQAAPDNFARRLSRFTRRHRAISIAVFIAMLFMTAAGTWVHLSRIHAANVEKVITKALDAFEDVCQPLAENEMSNLRDVQRVTSKIREFSDDFLNDYADNAAMRPHTARVYALRATVERVELLGETKAAEDYQCAVAIFEQLVKESHNVEFAFRLARVRLSQSRLWLQRGELAEALAGIEKARDTFESLLHGQLDDRKLQRSLAEAYHSLGEVWMRLYRKEGRPEALTKAGEDFEQGKELRLALLKSTLGAEQQDYQRDLARSYGYLGDLRLAEGKVGQARRDYEESLKLREGLLRDDNPENRFQYARGLANFGVFERDFGGDLDKTFEALEHARELQAHLVDQFENVASFRLDLITTLNLQAELHLFAAANGGPDATDQLEKALKDAKSAEDYHDPSQSANAWRRELALCLVLQAIALKATDRDQSSRHAVKVEKAISDGMEPGATPDADALFVQALAHALSDKRDDLGHAWNELKSSRSLGQNAVARIERHKRLGFRSLAESPEWAQELDELLKDLHSRVITE